MLRARLSPLEPFEYVARVATKEEAVRIRQRLEGAWGDPLQRRRIAGYLRATWERRALDVPG
jgi:hypothetical protein